MIDLYCRNDGSPQPLPAVAYTKDGFSRTDLANQPDSRRELGFVLFGSYDPRTQAVVKRGDGYAIVPIDQAGDPDPADIPKLIDAERDRRIDLGITFSGKFFQTADLDRERIDRSRISAMAALMNGVQEGNLRWHGLPVDFFWIAADNSRVPMDAQTMVAFGNAVAAREGVMIVAGNDLKRRIAAGETIPDITGNSLWPA